MNSGDELNSLRLTRSWWEPPSALFALAMLCCVPLCLRANDCSPFPLPQAVETADLIFTGRLLSVEEVRVVFFGKRRVERVWVSLEDGSQADLKQLIPASEERTERFRFTVDRVWKGRSRKRVTVWNDYLWRWYGHRQFKTETLPDGTTRTNINESIPDPPETRYLIFAWKSKIKLPGKIFRRRVYMFSMCTWSGRESERRDALDYLKAQEHGRS